MQKDGTFFINELLDCLVYFYRSRYTRVPKGVVIDLVLADFLGLLQSVGEQLTDDAWRCAIAVILLIYHNVVSF